MEENIVYKKEIQKDYYTKKSQKIKDFVYGFFLSVLLPIVSGLFLFRIRSNQTATILLVSPVVVLILISIYYFKKERKYVTIGMIITPLILFLIFGTCMFTLNSASSGSWLYPEY